MLPALKDGVSAATRNDEVAFRLEYEKLWSQLP